MRLPADPRRTWVAAALAVPLVLGLLSFPSGTAVVWTPGFSHGEASFHAPGVVGIPRGDPTSRMVPRVYSTGAEPSAAPLTAGPPTPKSPTVDAGQTLTLTSAASGGTQPYSYQWYKGVYSQCQSDTAISGAVNVTFSFVPPTNAYYCYQVTDSASPHATAASSTDLVEVNSTPQAGAVTPASPTVDLGQSVTLAAHPSAGAPPYSYQWYSGSSSPCSTDTAIAGATGPTYLASPTSNASFCYVLGDSAVGSPAVFADSPLDAVVVNPALTAGPVTPATPTIDSGQSVTLYSDASGGTPSYVYQWSAGSSGTCSGDDPIIGATAASFTATPSTSTYYCYSVSDGSTNSPTVLSPTDWVNTRPVLVAAAISPAAPGIDQGQTLTLTANPTGGTAPYAIQWYYGTYPSCGADNNPIAGATGATYTFAPTGSDYYCYGVTDSAAPPVTALSATALVAVNATPMAGDVTPSSPIIDAGQSVNLTAHPSQGTPPYHFQWYEGAVGTCTAGAEVGGANSATLEASPGSSTWFCYVLADSAVGTPAQFDSSSMDAVIVNPALVAGAITSTPPADDAGHRVTLTAHPSGGTPVYGYQWYSGSSSTCSSDQLIDGATSVNYTADPSSTTYYCYALTDGSANAPTIDSATFEIYVPPSPGPAFPWTYVIVGVAAVAVAVGVVVVLVRRHRRSNRPPGDFGAV